MKPFKIKKAVDGQFYFVVTAANGKIRVTSETYTRRRDAVKGARGLYDDLTHSWQYAVRKNREASITDLIVDETL